MITAFLYHGLLFFSHFLQNVSLVDSWQTFTGCCSPAPVLKQKTGIHET